MELYLYLWASKWARTIPTRIAGARTFPVYPSPLPVGEPDYLSYHASITPKEAQHRYFGPNLNNHIYSLCVLGTLVQFFLTISASSTSAPASRALVPLASSVRSLCHLCSSSSLLLLGISKTPTLIPGWRRNTSDCKAVTPSVLIYRVCSTCRVSVTRPIPDGYGDGQESIPETVNGDGDGMNSP